MHDKRDGTLVVLACHGVFDPATHGLYAEHPDDRPIYAAHLHYAFQHLMWQAATSPLLVISGGATQPQRPCVESRSYLEWADVLGLPIPANVAIEEYALTSIENLLLSLYVYHQTRGCYPTTVAVISWAFKGIRFTHTLDAINRRAPLGETWPPLQFFPVGALSGSAKTIALTEEARYITAL